MLVEDCCTPVVNGHIRMNANFLFDEGAQCSFISVQLATKLQVRPTTTTQVALSSFGAESQTFQTLGVAVETLLDSLLYLKRLETCQSYSQ